MIGGATMAWFTDSDEAGPVTMTAGTLLIDIDELRLANTTVNLDILNPGDEFEYNFNVVNVGTKNFKYMGLLCYEDILGVEREEFPEGKDYGTNPLSEVLEVELSVGNNVFYTGTLADYNNLTDPAGGIPNPLPAGLDANSQPPIIFGEAGPMAPGASWPYKVKIKFPTTAGNEYQGSQLKAAFVVMAKQIHPYAEYGFLAVSVRYYKLPLYHQREYS